MDTFTMAPNSVVKLQVDISSEALPGTDVFLNNQNKRKSSLYHIKVDLGNSNDLNGQDLAIISKMLVLNGNADNIIANTIVKYTLDDGVNPQEFEGIKTKIDNSFFVVHGRIHLTL